MFNRREIKLPLFEGKCVSELAGMLWKQHLGLGKGSAKEGPWDINENTNEAESPHALCCVAQVLFSC